MKDSATQRGPKVAIAITIHDFMEKHELRGVGRNYLWRKYFEICFQRCIYYQNLGGMVRFEFKRPYKLQVVVQ